MPPSDDHTSPPTGTANFPIGIPQEQLRWEERPLPAGEPVPWAPNAELRVVGKPTARVDGHLEVTGRARYTADVQLPGMLHARRICSPHPHARIKSVDTTRAQQHPDFRALQLLDRPMGLPSLRDPSQELASPYPILRYVGQPIGAIAATTPEAAEEIARLVDIEYELMPFTAELDQAQRANAPLVYPGPVDMAGTAGGGGAASGLAQHGNVRGPLRTVRGDIATGFTAAEVVVEGEFHTQVQTHSALEPHGVVADWREDGLTVYASTQGTASVQDELAEVLGLDKSRIRVITEFMGGGFGAKFGAGSYGVLAARLSRQAKAPVRLVLDRAEEHQSAGNRPATAQRLRIGARRDGTLTAIELSSVGTAGVATGAGVGLIAERLYACPNFQSEQSDVFIHAGPGCAMRAPGFPQGAFALEQCIDELAERLGVDPLALRDRIDVREESGALARRVERRIGAERFGWARRRPAGSDRGTLRRGLGVAQAYWPRIVRLNAACEVRLLRDGTVELRSGVQDIGTGTKTVLAQVVAEELGLAARDIVVRIGDTRFPAGPSSGGSTTTASITPAAREAAAMVRRQLFELVAPRLQSQPDTLAIVDGAVTSHTHPSRRLPLRKAATLMKGEAISATAQRRPDYEPPAGVAVVAGLGGVQFTEVVVDTETGIIRVERVVAVHDCGRPMNPLGIENQINGGIIQGISYALYEDRHLDLATGRMLNPNFEQYKIASAWEVPAIEVVLVEDYRGRSSTDASGVGEPATIPTAASIANAVYNAIGVRMRTLPMTPARVLEALAKTRTEARG
ncbi:MAG TPA: xanthine dehydrogenase family protein molybdopterin-binding subunit [Candidatus Binatia bacterium]